MLRAGLRRRGRAEAHSGDMCRAATAFGWVGLVGAIPSVDLFYSAADLLLLD